MKQRFSVLFLVFVLALALVPSVSAQEAGCFDLPQEDCAIINSASVQSGDITSFVQDFSITLTASGLETLGMMLPGIPPEITFEVTGVGPFAFTPDAEIPVALSLDMSIDTDFGEEPIVGEFPFAIVGGYVYIPGDGEVIGIPVDAEDATGALSGLGLEGLGIDPTTLDAEAVDPASLGELLGGDPTELAVALEGLAQYVNYVRLADEDLMGMTVYPFEWSLDLTALLQSEEFNQLVQMAGGLAGEDPTTQQLLTLVGPLLQGLESELVITQSVGAEDNYIHEIDMYLPLTLDISPLLGGEPGSMAPIDVEFNFNVVVSEINSAPAAVAPEGARLLSEEEAEALMGS